MRVCINDYFSPQWNEIEHDTSGNSDKCVMSIRDWFSFKFSVTFLHSNFKTFHVLLFCDVE